MTAEGTFPKSDGDILYASEVNDFNDGTATTKAYNVYDGTGGQTISAATVVNLDTATTDVGSIFSLSSDEITISETGTFLFNYRVAFQRTGSAFGVAGAKIWLTKDSGAGYAAIEGSYAFATVTLSAIETNTAIASIVLNVTTGDKFKLNIDINSGINVAIVSGVTATGLCVVKV